MSTKIPQEKTCIFPVQNHLDSHNLSGIQQKASNVSTNINKDKTENIANNKKSQFIIDLKNVIKI